MYKLGETKTETKRKNKKRVVASQTARSRFNPYSTFIILGLTKGKGLYMASESLLSCISPFLRHLRNQLP